MGLLSKVKVSALVIVLLVIMRINPYEACRVLEDKGGVWERRGGHLLGSLQKGPVPSGPSGCTNVPGNPGPSCPVQEMHFAGDVLAHAGAYPPQVIPLGVASNGQWSYCYDWKFLFLFFFSSPAYKLRLQLILNLWEWNLLLCADVRSWVSTHQWDELGFFFFFFTYAWGC